MSRYIDADALKNDLYSIIKADCGYTADVLAGLMIAERVIDNAQTADVAPVRHGQWERIGIRGRKGLQIYPCCSACGMVSAAYRSEWEGPRGAWKFCPNLYARGDPVRPRAVQATVSEPRIPCL